MHTVINGTTGSGKSTYAVQLAKAAKQTGFPIGVLDPMFDQHDRWPRQEPGIITHDFDEFEQWARENINAWLFIDEGHDSIGKNRWNDDLWWLFRYGRHYGHRVAVITQYPMDLPPVVRINCRHLVCFNLDGDSAYALSRNFGHEAINDATTLQPFEFIYITRGQTEYVRNTIEWEY